MNAEIGQKFEPAVGALLRASRLRCGEDLREVAAVLRIRHAYLEAIEEGRYEDLPGITYAVGFVRTYAEHLGLDTEEVVRRFKAESENLERRTELVFPSPIGERGTPGAAIIFIGVLVAALAYGAWYVGTSKDSVLEDLVTPLPDRLAALLPGDREETSETARGPTTATAAPQTDMASASSGSPGSPPPQPEVEDPGAAVENAPAEMLRPEQPASDAPPQPTTEMAVVPGSGETAPIIPAPEVAPEAAAPEAAAPEAAAPEAAMREPEPMAEAEAAAPTESPVPGSEASDVAAVTTTVARAEPEAAPEPPVAPPAPLPAEATAPPTPAAATPETADTEPVVAEAPSAAPPPAPEQATEVGTPQAEIPTPAEVAEQPVAEVAADEQPVETPQPAPVVSTESPPTPQAAEVPVAPEAPETPAVWPEDAPAAPGAVSTEPEAVEATPEPESEPVQEAAVPEAPTVAAAATPAGSADGGARIEVRALSDSWIQIRDGVARRLLVTRLLRAGDTYVVPDQPGLTLLTGNAGALEILVDGQTVEPIGEEGAVRRNVVLNADRLLAGTAVVD